MEQHNAGLGDMLDRVREARQDNYLETVWVSLAGIQTALDSQSTESRPVAYPDPFRGFENHWVLWEAATSFTVYFRGPNPIKGKPQLAAVHDPDHGVWAAAGLVRHDAATPKPYKYDLAVHAEPTILIADPIGEIDRDPTFI